MNSPGGDGLSLHCALFCGCLASFWLLLFGTQPGAVLVVQYILDVPVALGARTMERTTGSCLSQLSF